MPLRTAFGLLFLALVAGCVGSPRGAIDGVVCDLAALPRDTHLVGKPIPPPATPEESSQTRLLDKLELPGEIPGAELPKLSLPSPEKGDGKDRQEALKKLYPELPSVGPDNSPVPGPQGKPFTLAQLQSLALSNHPGMRQAAARVESARGAAEQAGLPPNPTIGLAGNTVGTAHTAGQIGPYFDQVIKLGNKLQLNRAVAAMDLRLAEVALRKTEMDLLTNVRRQFFKVLVAQESVRILRAMEQMFNDIHQVHVAQVTVGTDAAPYEPLQTRVQVTQARAELVQARNRLVAAWKQLASAVGMPGLPYTQLAANLTGMPLPIYDYATVLAHVLRSHTDLLTAESSIFRARHAVARAKAINIPDLNVNVQITPDFSTPGNPVTPTFTVGLAGLPVWHRNHGAIAEAEADLIAADEEMPRVRNDLTARVAEAFNRSAAFRTQIVLLRDGALPDQVQAYRAIRDRYVNEPGGQGDSTTLNIQDVFNAQQNLGNLLVTYLTALDNFTTALVDVADLAQTDDLYTLANQRVCIGPLNLPLVPECRPCSPLPPERLRIPASEWPVVTPAVRKTTPPAQSEETLPEPKKKAKDKTPPEPELPTPRRSNEPKPMPDHLPNLTGVTLPALEEKR